MFKSYLIVVITCFYFFISLPLAFGQNGSKKETNNDLLVINKLKNILRDQPENYFKAFEKVENQLLNKGQKDNLLKLYFFHVDYLYEIDSYDDLINTLHQMRELLREESEAEIIPVYLYLASAFHYKGNFDSLQYWYNKSSRYINPNSPSYGKYLSVEGYLYNYNGNYTLGIEKLLKAVKIFESTKDEKNLAAAFNNIAYLYGRIENVENQQFYLKKALKINKTLGHKYHLIQNYNNLGSTFKQQNKIKEALYYYDLAYEALKQLNFPLLLAQNLTNRANIFEKFGDYNKAEELFLECESICKLNNILYGQFLSSLNLGNLYRLQKKFPAAKVRLNKALDLTKILKTKKEEAQTFERLSWLARDMQDYKLAYNYQSVFQVLNDSLVNEAVRKEGNELKEKYESEKKEKEIITLSKQKLYNQYLILLLILTVFILLFVVQWWRNKHKLALKDRQKEELNKKFLNETLEIKEKELTSQVAILVQMQQKMDDLRNKSSKIINENISEHEKIKKIDSLLNKNPMIELNNNFELRLTSNNEDFFKVLLSKYPDLSPAELKLCAYLRLNPSTKDLALIMNRSMRTVESTRANIRKKMNLNPQDNLVTQLVSFSNY
jgi:tetratricopeptide (TPR) repeat protein